MTHQMEHLIYAPVIEQARIFDVFRSPAPNAVYEPLMAGFSLWANPNNRPKGEEWESAEYDKGATAQTCLYVGGVFWGWHETEPLITHLELSTTAYGLEQYYRKKIRGAIEAGEAEYADLINISEMITNREADLDWAKEKTRWIFELAERPIPEGGFVIGGEK